MQEVNKIAQDTCSHMSTNTKWDGFKKGHCVCQGKAIWGSNFYHTQAESGSFSTIFLMYKIASRKTCVFGYLHINWVKFIVQWFMWRGTRNWREVLQPMYLNSIWATCHSFVIQGSIRRYCIRIHGSHTVHCHFKINKCRGWRIVSQNLQPVRSDASWHLFWQRMHIYFLSVRFLCVLKNLWKRLLDLVASSAMILITRDAAPI